MNSLTKSVEEMRILKDMGDGLLNRMYFAKGQLLSNEKSKFLSDHDLLLIRGKIEKKFPQFIEYNKYQGGDIFSSKAGQIVEDLQHFYDLMMDIVDFATTSKDILKSYPLKMMELKLRKSRSLMVIYFDLLVAYMRVMYMIESIDEKLMIVAMYVAANNLVNSNSSATSLSYTSKVKALLDDCTNLNRHFIDLFVSSASFIRPMILDFKESFAQANHVDDLRNHYFLNPINQGDQMGSFAKRSLSSTNPLSAYSEVMAAVTNYSNYVMYAVIACPNLLFEEPTHEVVREATAFRAFATIHRDVSLNFHLELEKISNFYPHHTADTGVSVPKGMKFKSILKHISRDSIANAGLNQRKRRGFVTAELSVLNNIVRLTPGLIAPKFPMLLTACAIAKSELIAYFQHVDPFLVRKDTKANYVPASFVADDISTLLSELQASIGLIRQHSSLITNYFTEYLIVNDLKALVHLCTDCSNAISNLKAYFDSFVDDLKKVKDSHDALLPTPSLESFRLNWDRTLAIASAQSMNSYVKSSAALFEKLTDRMHAAYDRSYCADGIEHLIKTYCEPYEIQWFRNSFLTNFTNTFKDPSQYSKLLFSYFRVFDSIEYNFHPDCPEEGPRVRDKAVVICNTMLSDVMTFVLTLVKFLWDNVAALEGQTMPIEAARRLERNLQAKSQGGQAHEGYPGCESEVWAKKQIEKFVLIRRHLTLIMAACRNAEQFKVVGKSTYNPVDYIHQNIVVYFSTRLHSLFVASTDKPMSRYTIAMSKLNAGCRAIQFALNFIDFPVESLMKDILFKELQDSAAAPPGGVSPINAVVGTNNTILIHKLGNWFVGLAEYLSATSGTGAGGAVWIPSQQLFLSNVFKKIDTDDHQPTGETNRRGSVGANVGNFAAQSVEHFLVKEELCELVGFIGIQGLKTIESMLLNRVVQEIRIIIKFLIDYKNSLTAFEQNYHLSMSSALGMMSGLEVLFDSLKTMSILLLLRQMLYSALNSVTSEKFTDLYEAVHTAVNSVNVWSDLDLSSSISCLAANIGVHDEVDLSLASFVSQMNLKPEELQALQLFPLAASALFVSERYLKGTYIYQVEAFSDNEHCVAYGIAKLSMCFHVILMLKDVQASVPETALYTMPKINKISEEQEKFKSYIDKYLSVASHVLLTQRAIEVDKPTRFPYRGMCLMLDLFVRLCPLIDHGHLEKCFPNSLITAGLLEITLGKQTYNDTLNSFTHPVVVTES